MKAYRISYLRCGNQEARAGWRIAGKSDGISGNAINAYKTSQSANSKPEITSSLFYNAPVIFEFTCDLRNVYYSRLRYGIKDLVDRASMRADGLIFSLEKNPELQKNIGEVLNAQSSAFENQIDISENEIVAVLDEYETKESPADTDSLFIYDVEQTLCAVLWALTNESSATLYLVGELNEAEKLSFFKKIFNYLPFPLRMSVSFRTQPVGGANPLRFEFLPEKPKTGFFLNIKTGESNMQQLNLKNRFGKFNFIKYVISLENDKDRNDYFERLDKKTSELGGNAVADMKLFDTAHMLLVEKDSEIMSGGEIEKKLLDFLQLPINNSAIDEKIAELMKKIYVGNIVIDKEIVYAKILERLKITECEAFVYYGNALIAKRLVGAGNRQDSFLYIERLKNSEKEYLALKKQILKTAGGREFLDAYYGEYVFLNDVRFTGNFESDCQAVVHFLTSTAALPERKVIKSTAAEKFREIGKNLVQQYYEGRVSLTECFPKLVTSVQRNLPEFCVSVAEYIREMFWRNFKFEAYDFYDAEEYKVMRGNSPKSEMADEISRCFFWLYHSSSLDPKSADRLENILKRNYRIISAEAAEKIRQQFQQHSLSAVDKNNYIDFWYGIAMLSHENFIDFIIENNVTAFTDPKAFESNISFKFPKTDYFLYDDKLDDLLLQLEEYIAVGKKSKKTRSKLIDDAAQMCRVIEKEKKERAKVKPQGRGDRYRSVQKRNKK